MALLRCPLHRENNRRFARVMIYWLHSEDQFNLTICHDCTDCCLLHPVVDIADNMGQIQRIPRLFNGIAAGGLATGHSAGWINKISKKRNRRYAGRTGNYHLPGRNAG